MTRFARGFVIFCVVIALWEGLYRLGLINPLLIGAPSLIASAALKDGGTFLLASRVTAFEIVVATAIAWVGGVSLGVIVGGSIRSTMVFSPIFSAMIAVPLVVLYPVIVAWTGIGPTSKIVYGAAAGFFPIALAAASGVSAIDRRYADMARALGASRGQILLQVMTRLALPTILSGLRVGTSLVIISVVQSEMLSAVNGLGFWISYYRSLFDVGHVYFGILLVLLMAAAANAVLTQVERRFRWVKG
ncbi:MAG TPA: ABC transporter permease subunit [Xanthobacteraceae bacterium]|jgi:NitT/TauT family transport system permease protein|nr:ABC transporter permease subunit [Xanthobacteraceae bacterium]